MSLADWAAIATINGVVISTLVVFGHWGRKQLGERIASGVAPQVDQVRQELVAHTRVEDERFRRIDDNMHRIAVGQALIAGKLGVDLRDGSAG